MKRLAMLAALALAGCGGSETTCYPNEIRCSESGNAVLQCAETGDAWTQMTCDQGLSCQARARIDPTTGTVYIDLVCAP